MSSVQAVVLAAGLSRRAGSFKPALDLGGRPMILRCVDAFLETCSSIIVVGGHEYDRLAALVVGIPELRLVRNEGYLSGMFSSVRAAVAAVDADRFFLIPGDYPFVRPETCRVLLEASGAVVVPSFGGRAGHPVLLDAALIHDILAEKEDSTLRAVLSRHPRTFVPVDDPGVLRDVDTEDDYRAAVLEMVGRAGGRRADPASQG